MRGPGPDHAFAHPACTAFLPPRSTGRAREPAIRACVALDVQLPADGTRSVECRSTLPLSCRRKRKIADTPVAFAYLRTSRVEICNPRTGFARTTADVQSPRIGRPDSAAERARRSQRLLVEGLPRRGDHARVPGCARARGVADR